MFVVEEPSVPYVDPWESSFQERLNALSKAPRRVAYFYETPDNSTFRYRVYNMIQALRESNKKISAAYFCSKDIEHFARVVERADILVVCRARYNEKLNQFITHARNKGKQVYFDIDDLVFDSDYVHLILETLDQDLSNPAVWDTWFAYVGRIGATLRLCDAVITTNDYLASQVRAFAGKPTYVIPNFLNQEQLDISRRIYEKKASRNFYRTDKIHLGYFSGTPTHNRDFDILVPALTRILDQDQRIMVYIVGYMELKDPLRRYTSRIEFYNLQDFINLQRLIGLMEVNLIPLQDNLFTNCKSELKYFEAGIVGSLSIASPVYSYANAIRDGENGYLAMNTDWFEKLTMMTDSMGAYPEMAERTFRDAEKRYAWYNQLTLIEKTLFPNESPSVPSQLSSICSVSEGVQIV